MDIYNFALVQPRAERGCLRGRAIAGTRLARTGVYTPVPAKHLAESTDAMAPSPVFGTAVRGAFRCWLRESGRCVNLNNGSPVHRSGRFMPEIESAAGC